MLYGVHRGVGGTILLTGAHGIHTFIITTTAITIIGIITTIAITGVGTITETHGGIITITAAAVGGIVPMPITTDIPGVITGILIQGPIWLATALLTIEKNIRIHLEQMQKFQQLKFLTAGRLLLNQALQGPEINYQGTPL